MALVVEVFLTLVVVLDFDFDFVFVFDSFAEGVILATVVWEGVTEVRVVLVLALIVTNVEVLEREADSLIVVRIVNFVLLVVVDGFTVLLVDGEFGVLDAVEDLELTELVEAGDPLREDEEEGRGYW